MFDNEQDPETHELFKFLKTYVFKLENSYPDPEVYNKLEKYPYVAMELSVIEDQSLEIRLQDEQVPLLNKETYLNENSSFEDLSLDTINEFMRDEDDPESSMIIASSILFDQ